jgi:hypothetical protein
MFELTFAAIPEAYNVTNVTAPIFNVNPAPCNVNHARRSVSCAFCLRQSASICAGSAP